MAPISDHAVLRFLERAYGMADLIAAAREEMTRGAAVAIDFQAKVVVVHGCRLVIRNGHVVTVLPKAECGADRARPHRKTAGGC